MFADRCSEFLEIWTNRAQVSWYIWPSHFEKGPFIEAVPVRSNNLEPETSWDHLRQLPSFCLDRSPGTSYLVFWERWPDPALVNLSWEYNIAICRNFMQLLYARILYTNILVSHCACVKNCQSSNLSVHVFFCACTVVRWIPASFGGPAAFCCATRVAAWLEDKSKSHKTHTQSITKEEFAECRKYQALPISGMY